METMDIDNVVLYAGYTIEIVGVLIIIAGSAVSSFRFAMDFSKDTEGVAYHAYRRQLGRSIILGLEFLIAGDIIRTVVVADTLMNVTVLGLIVLIRTFLSFTLYLEVEGRWPWSHSSST